MHKRLCKFSALLVFLLVVASGFSNAQILTGSIRGNVWDESGLPLPGVAVEITSQVMLGGVHSQTTDEKGFYRFVYLPPGLYTIVYKLEGFQKIERPGVKVSVKGTVTQDIVMTQAAVEQFVTVTAQAPIVDVTKSGMSTNFDKDLLEKIPSGRNSFLDVVKQTPGLLSHSDDMGNEMMTAFGSNMESNSFQIDGLDISSARTGENYLFPNQELFTEVEVSGMGTPAEYGGFTGAVINVVTKSGGNSYSGLLSYYGQYQGLTGNNNPNPKLDSFQRHEFFDAALGLGGPILKDKLWFFGSANITRNDVTNWQEDPRYHSPVKSDNYYLKLSLQIASKHKLVGAVGYRRWASESVPTPYRTLEATLLYKIDVPAWNLMYTWIVNNNTYLELKTSGYSGKEDGRNAHGSTPNDPVHSDLLTGIQSNAPYWPFNSYYSRYQGGANLSHFAEDFLGGDHDLKMGVQYNRGGQGSVLSYSGGKLYYDYGGEPYLLYAQDPFYYGGTVHNIGAFVDDSWRVGQRLTLNLGLRYDYTRGDIPSYPVYKGWDPIPGQKTAALSKLVVWNKFSPRIGFAYQLTSDRKTVLKGHYGLYHETLYAGTIEWPGPNSTDWAAYYWNGSEWVPYYFLSGKGQWNLDSKLEPVYCHQLLLGLEREIFPDFSASLTGVYKKMKNYPGLENTAGKYELVPMVSPDNGQTYMVYNQLNVGENFILTTNPEGFEQTYKGAILSLKKRYSHNWLFNASLTLSRSEGFSNITTGVGNGWQISIMSSSGNYNRGKDPNDWTNGRGLMQYDRTWVLKAQFGYTLPWDILASANFQYMTGRPFVSRVRVYPDQGMRRILAEPRDGKHRFASLSMLDFRLQKTFFLYNSLKLSAVFDVFNVFNVNTVTGFASEDRWSSAYLDPTAIPFPRRAQVGLKIEF